MKIFYGNLYVDNQQKAATCKKQAAGSLAFN